MATYLPTSGSFSTYATRFVDPSLGFALGWNYWFNWVITVAADISIAALVVTYWEPLRFMAPWAWSLLFAIIFLLNTLSVRVYGESEYWFALIKVVTGDCVSGRGRAHHFRHFGRRIHRPGQYDCR